MIKSLNDISFLGLSKFDDFLIVQQRSEIIMLFMHHVTKAPNFAQSYFLMWQTNLYLEARPKT
jgi:hypothetical protein